MSRRKKTGCIVLLMLIAVIICAAVILLRNYKPLSFLIPKQYFTAEDFSITTITSPVDFNGNGIDDYTDILFGARKDAENYPRYDGTYYDTGYPPDDIGVCTDVIWRAFKHAGYSLKDMVNQDIANHLDLYPRVNGNPDPNIDFRRVMNLQVYFERKAESLTLDTADIAQWQPGDIVIYGTDHIGIVSDRRNEDGVPYLIHNAGQLNREENALVQETAITGHYRFNASLLEQSELIAFTE